MSRHLNIQQNKHKVATVVIGPWFLAHMLPSLFLIVLGWCLRVHSSLSSLALQRGNIKPPQVGPHKTGLYLQRASSQHTISMQKHAHRHHNGLQPRTPKVICNTCAPTNMFSLRCQSSPRLCCSCCLMKI